MRSKITGSYMFVASDFRLVSRPSACDLLPEYVDTVSPFSGGEGRSSLKWQRSEKVFLYMYMPQLIFV
jgi:hypothetical protein